MNFIRGQQNKKFLYNSFLKIEEDMVDIIDNYLNYLRVDYVSDMRLQMDHFL